MMKYFASLFAAVIFLFVRQTVCAADWTSVRSPNSGQGANNLVSVAAIADSDIWATGLAFNQSLSAYQTLAEHWNGTRWSIVTTPNATSGYNFLNGVAAVASNNLWAVGQAATGSNYATLNENWNGASWQIVPSPNVAGQSCILQALAIILPNDIWAVGYSQNANFMFFPLAEHWNGSAWSIVSTPGQSRLISVSATATNDVWAVGESEPGEQSLTMHWNGSAWSIVPSPYDSPEDNILYGVAALAPNDAWAVGQAGSEKSLAIHWDGTRWNLVLTPTFVFPNDNPALVGIVALSSSNIWVAGQFLDSSIEQTLSENWNGADWSIVPTPNRKNANNRLAAIAVTPSGTLWAVGTRGVFEKPEQTLTLRKLP